MYPKRIDDAVRHYLSTRDGATQERILAGLVRGSEINRRNDAVTDDNEHQHVHHVDEPREEPDKGQDEEQGEEVTSRPDLGPSQGKDQEPRPESQEVEDEFQQKALAFFAQRQRERAREGEISQPTLTWNVAQKAIAALQEGFKWNCENDVGELWVSREPVIASDSSENCSPLQRLTKMYESVLSSAHSTEVKRRIIALLIHHECQEHRISIKKRKRKQRETGLPIDTATVINFTAYAWIRFVRSWGLGGLVIPDTGARDM